MRDLPIRLSVKAVVRIELVRRGRRSSRVGRRWPDVGGVDVEVEEFGEDGGGEFGGQCGEGGAAGAAEVAGQGAGQAAGSSQCGLSVSVWVSIAVPVPCSRWVWSRAATASGSSSRCWVICSQLVPSVSVWMSSWRRAVPGSSAGWALAVTWAGRRSEPRRQLPS